MKYFAIKFPYDTTFVLKGEIDQKNLVHALSNSKGLIGYSGAIYNPSQFISVLTLENPGERQKDLARNVSEVLF